LLAIRIDGGLRAWSISGERREAKKDFNTEVTEGRTRRAQRKEKRGREKPKTQVKNRTWGTRLRITQRSQRARSSQRREKREEVEERKSGRGEGTWWSISVESRWSCGQPHP